MKMTNFNKFH